MKQIAFKRHPFSALHSVFALAGKEGRNNILLWCNLCQSTLEETWELHIYSGGSVISNTHSVINPQRTHPFSSLRNFNRMEYMHLRVVFGLMIQGDYCLVFWNNQKLLPCSILEITH